LLIVSIKSAALWFSLIFFIISWTAMLLLLLLLLILLFFQHTHTHTHTHEKTVEAAKKGEKEKSEANSL